ncbi:hypothetical protein GCM10020255_021160 [Rhodococcus baikonurensis]
MLMLPVTARFRRQVILWCTARRAERTWGERYGLTMTPIEIDLPDPAAAHRMLAGWAAAYAAVFSFSDLHSTFTVENNRVTYRDGGGSHFEFISLPSGRAVIFGFDRHSPDPALEGARAVLCDHGAEPWWLDTASNDEILNFAYGYEVGRWRAVGHDPTRVVPFVLAPGSSGSRIQRSHPSRISSSRLRKTFLGNRYTEMTRTSARCSMLDRTSTS